MPDDPSLPGAVPESKTVTKKRTRLSVVWLIPIVAAIIGAWVAVTKIRSQGPEITIIFKSAEGLDAGKTKIRYNGVEIGKITAFRLSADHKQVITTAQMEPHTEGFLLEDTRFWVVRPTISGADISGLSTIISGAYIGVEIGHSAKKEHDFIALEKAPVVTGDVSGRFFTLKTPVLGSLNRGTPIFFRRLQAGEVAAYELDPDGKSLTVKIFVRAPYDQYVTANTRFWEASGIDVALSAAGLHLQTESLLSILIGGIAFETPDSDPVLPPAEAETQFTLFRDQTDAFKPPAQDPQTYLLVFDQSVRGLSVGAPVELKGIQIGEVTDIRAEFDAQTKEFKVPVTIRVDIARFGVKLINKTTGTNAIAAHREVMNTLVSRGLRAQLRSGSLISGSLFVAVDFFPEAKTKTLDWTQKPVELPTAPGQIQALETTLGNLGKKFDELQFKEIGEDLRKTITGLDETLASARGTLTNAETLLKTANVLIAPNSPLIGGVDGTLQQVGDAARSMRVLADYLERHPEAFIRGKTGDTK